MLERQTAFADTQLAVIPNPLFTVPAPGQQATTLAMTAQAACCAVLGLTTEDESFHSGKKCRSHHSSIFNNVKTALKNHIEQPNTSSMTPKLRGNVPSLAPELWAKVFAQLELRPENFKGWIDDDNLELKQNQLEVHQLKLVCKQFRDLYGSHSDLVQQLYVCHQFTVGLVPSLLAWLQ